MTRARVPNSIARAFHTGSLVMSLAVGFPILLSGCGGADQTTGTHVAEPSPEVVKKNLEMMKKAVESGAYGKQPTKR
jgi:hypothetical protein